MKMSLDKNDLLGSLMHLAAQKLVNLRYNDARDLVIAKYSKRAFWDSTSWDNHPELIQARGQVFSTETNEIVAQPFAKVFNYTEKGAGANLHHESRVDVVEKINGFLGIAFKHKNKWVVTSSGTFDSEYAAMAREALPDFTLAIMNQAAFAALARFEYENINFMFEITDARDPHIIQESYGAWFIGASIKVEGEWQAVSEDDLDQTFRIFRNSLTAREVRDAHIMRPWRQKRMLFFDVLKVVNDPSDFQEEGFMVYSDDGLFKLKSKYYLTNKFLARTKKDMSSWWETGRVGGKDAEKYDEELQALFIHISGNYTCEEWSNFDEFKRLEVIKLFYINDIPHFD